MMLMIVVLLMVTLTMMVVLMTMVRLMLMVMVVLMMLMMMVVMMMLMPAGLAPTCAPHAGSGCWSLPAEAQTPGVSSVARKLLLI